MAASLMTVVATDAWERALFESESRYFEAAANCMPLLGGTLSVMPDLVHLPSGCVLHGMDPEHAASCRLGWLRTLEARFRSAGARLCRLYLPAGTAHLNQLLLGAGYRPVRELGMVGELDDDAGAGGTAANLAIIDDEEGWREKIGLYRAAGHGPDGHDMQNGRFADLEHFKCRAGYMRSYLYLRDGRPIATVSLALRDGFARLKNLLVAPEFRDQGVGYDLVRALQGEARRRGARLFGCFVSSKAALNTYRRCGMWDMCFHTEWSRPL